MTGILPIMGLHGPLRPPLGTVRAAVITVDRALAGSIPGERGAWCAGDATTRRNSRNAPSLIDAYSQVFPKGVAETARGMHAP